MPSLPLSEMSERSNAKRREIKEIRAALASGEMSLAHAITNHRDVIGDKLIVEVLLWCNKIGRTKAVSIVHVARANGIDLVVQCQHANRSTVTWLDKYIDTKPGPKKFSLPSLEARVAA